MTANEPRSPADTERLEELALKVEAAEGPDRELDALISVALKTDILGLTDDDHEYLTMPDRHEPGPGVQAGHYWFHCRSGMSLRSAVPFTASLDAALTLVPEGWHLGELRNVNPTWWFSSLAQNHVDESGAEASAVTPALALTATGLRAHAAGKASRVTPIPTQGNSSGDAR